MEEITSQQKSALLYAAQELRSEAKATRAKGQDKVYRVYAEQYELSAALLEQKAGAAEGKTWDSRSRTWKS